MPELSSPVSFVSDFRVVTTFAGAGGSSTGYEMAGGKVLLAAEWDEHAIACYRLNHPKTDVYQGDVAKLTVDEVLRRTSMMPGELDIFDGSPPCQGFSTVGDRSMSDSRNQLFREYVRLLAGLRPKAFVMENVSGMVRGKMKLIFVEALKALREVGYNVRCQLLDASYFGVPQQRQRIIFIGVRNDLGLEVSHPKPQTRQMSLRRALESSRVKAVREGFGPTNLIAVRSEDFANKWRSADRPCCTIVKSRPPILLLSDGSQREMTAKECALVGSFPDSYQWVGSEAKIIERIGNSVPPLLMKAIALHIKDNVLRRAIDNRPTVEAHTSTSD